MKRGRKPHPLSSAVLSKRKEQSRIASLYFAERQKLYSGEEEFMNTLHPFEETGKNCGKKSSPIQKAMISCIKENNGAASEEQLLEYITQRWQTIEKYSSRGFSMEPSIRIIRLNLAVRKKARHLFLKDPKNSEMWKLNSNPRKVPLKRILFKRPYGGDYSDFDDSDVEETQISVKPSEIEINQNYTMKENTFERCVEDYMRTIDRSVTIDEILKSLFEYRHKKGIFASLALDRRIRACLIVLKSEGKVFYDETTNSWTNQKPLSKIEKLTFSEYRLSAQKI